MDEDAARARLLATTIPPQVLVPCMGMPNRRVMSTGGCADRARWIDGSIAGIGMFDCLDDARARASSDGCYVVPAADHHRIIRRGSIYDVAENRRKALPPL